MTNGLVTIDMNDKKEQIWLHICNTCDIGLIKGKHIYVTYLIIKSSSSIVVYVSCEGIHSLSTLASDKPTDQLVWSKKPGRYVLV